MNRLSTGEENSIKYFRSQKGWKQKTKGVETRAKFYASGSYVVNNERGNYNLITARF
jgi:hypothetical protein